MFPDSLQTFYTHSLILFTLKNITGNCFVIHFQFECRGVCFVFLAFSAPGNLARALAQGIQDTDAFDVVGYFYLLVFPRKDLCKARPQTPSVFKVFALKSDRPPVEASSDQEWYSNRVDISVIFPVPIINKYISFHCFV